MTSRLTKLANQAGGAKKLTRPSPTVKYGEYEKEIRAYINTENGITIAFLTDVADTKLDSFLVNNYELSDITIFSDSSRSVKVPESEKVTNKVINGPFKKTEIPANSLVIAFVKNEEFSQKIKSITTITKSKVIIFTPFVIEDKDVDSTIGELNVYKINPEREPKVIEAVASTSSAPVKVKSPSPKAKAVVKKLPELPSRLKLPNFPHILTKPIGLIPDTEAWDQAFTTYIQSILRSLVLDPETVSEHEREQLIKDMTGPTERNNNENMLLIWRLAFTHESENPDTLSNYDQLEAIGDKHLSAAFKEFTRSKYPRISDDELNEYTSRYMSEEFQVPMGMKLHFLEWVIMDRNFKPSEKICEDIFESFCGALVTIGDKIMGGVGYLLVRNIIRGIFGTFEYDPNLKYGKAITILSQGFRSHRWGDNVQQDISLVTERRERKGEVIWSATYRLTNIGFKTYVESELSLLPRPKPLPSDFTGITVSATGKTVDEAKEKASNETLDAINQLGITTENIVSHDLRRVYFYRSNKTYHDLVEAAYRKAGTKNITKLFVKKIKNIDDEDNHYMLVGVGDDLINRKMMPLDSFAKNSKKEEDFTKMLESYITR